jgi:hypothetical protein
MSEYSKNENNMSDLSSPILYNSPITPRSSRNMILRNSTPTSSPKKVKVLQMNSPRKCNTRNCKNFAYRLVEDRDKSGVSSYYCEKCIDNICMINPKGLKISYSRTPPNEMDFVSLSSL